jgi:hypothetical protein
MIMAASIYGSSLEETKKKSMYFTNYDNQIDEDTIWLNTYSLKLLAFTLLALLEVWH